MSPCFINILSIIKQHKTECACLVLFVVSALIGFCSHELTYDEAQAWQIAKTASWKDIVTLIPVYEGHPPFWHLLLAVPAKLNMEWRVIYPLVGLGGMITCAVLILFASPFPKWVRCLLPFNYFLFYQYGIIVRPYGLMVVIMLLLALIFPQKEKHPVWFVGLLASLCACHIYGIAIAGGITLAWLWEMRTARPWKVYIPALFKDKCFYYLLGLLAFVLLIMGIVFLPHSGQTSAIPFPTSWLRHLVYLIFAMPAEAVLTDFQAAGHLHADPVPWLGLLLACGIGVLLWALVLTAFSRKNILYLLLPYLCLVVPMFFYSSNHHIGLALILFIWYAWISTPAKQLPKQLQRFAQGALVLALLVPILWSARVLYLEHTLTISPGEEIVQFLQEHHLTEQPIFTAWTAVFGAQQLDPNFQPMAVLINMYTDHNIIANFNEGKSMNYTLPYTQHTPQQTRNIYKVWREKGLPRVVIGDAPLELVYPGENFNQYYRVLSLRLTELWKARLPVWTPINVYVRVSP